MPILHFRKFHGRKTKNKEAYDLSDASYCGCFLEHQVLTSRSDLHGFDICEGYSHSDTDQNKTQESSICPIHVWPIESKRARTGLRVLVKISVFLCHGNGIIGILKIYRCHKASRTDELEGSTECQASTKPRKSIFFCCGWSTDFTGWIVKPRLLNKQYLLYFYDMNRNSDQQERSHHYVP